MPPAKRPGGSPQVHLHHGEDTEARLEADRAVEAAVLDPMWASMNHRTLPADAPLSQVLDALNAQPFGAGGSLVVLRDPPWASGKSEDPALEAFLAFLAQGLPEGVHLLVSAAKADVRLKAVKALAEAGEAKAFAPPKPWEAAKALRPWAEARAQALGLRLERGALELLLEAVGVDRARLGQELEKLAVAAEGGRVEVALVQALVPGVQAGALAIADAVRAGDAPGALVALGQVLALDHPLRALSAMATRIRSWTKLLRLQEAGLPSARIASLAGAHPFVVGKDLEALRGWQAEAMEANLLELGQLDAGLKSGRWPGEAGQRLAIELALWRMAGRRKGRR